MHLKQRFGLRVIRFENVISKRPRGRQATSVYDLAEVTLTQSEQRRAVHLRVAANVVVQRRTEAVALGVGPGLVCLVDGVNEHRLCAPVQFAAWQIVAALDDQDTFSGGRDPLRQRSTAGPRADHDQVVVSVAHACILRLLGISPCVRSPGKGSCHRPRTR